MGSVKFDNRKNGDFLEAMNLRGIYTREDIIADGVLRRFYVEGDKTGSKNGFYVLFDDDVCAGAFGCWRRGISETWCATAKRKLTETEITRRQTRMIELQKRRREQEIEKNENARAKAVSIWNFSTAALDNHPYLIKKRVKSHQLRIYKGLLVIPMRDELGTLHSLQFIDDAGNKRFLSGGRKKGCYFGLGNVASSLCIAEGYATAASIYESTLVPVAVAFDAGNILPVGAALRKKFPNSKITICADNDAHLEYNIGLTKARAAAQHIGAYLAFPPSAGDFNDFLHGGSYE